MSSTVNGENQLECTGERFLPDLMAGVIELEHVHRYAMARELAFGKEVLDIACGEGYGADLLAAVAKQVTGVDISQEAVAYATAKYPRKNLEFVCGSAAEIPLADASVDLVVSFETIEHHAEHREMLAEIRRVLRPDGVLLISSPDKYEYSDVPGYRNPYHVRELYLNEFEGLLRAEFSQVEVFGQRVCYGSFVGPLGDSDAVFATFSQLDQAIQRTEGLKQPIYFVAVASNATLPQVSVGLYDGSRALDDQLARPDPELSRLFPRLFQLLNEREAAVLRLEDNVKGLDLEAARLLAELAARDGEVARLVGEVAARDGEVGRLAGELAARDGEVARLVGEVAARDGEVGRLAGELAGRDGEVARLVGEVSALDAGRVCLNEEVRQRDTQVELLRTSNATLGRLLDEERVARQRDVAEMGAERALLAAERDQLAQALHAVHVSTSWRLSAPLRVVKTTASNLHPLRRLQGLGSIGLRTSYRFLPLPCETKLKLKSALFSSFPFLFRNTAGYRAWQSFVKEQSRASAPVAHHLESAPTPARDRVECPHAAESFIGELYLDSRADYVPCANGPSPTKCVRTVAFYLPQFHTIAENDRWWGRGFTEWRNVGRAKPDFLGHYQPRLPGELGYYDLRVPSVQQRQVELAKAFGIDAFCFYLYWFGGRTLLELPLRQYLNRRELDLQFCVCWANENWTRTWDGLENDVLIAQEHSPEDDATFIAHVSEFLRDPRYLRISGKPVLLVYRPSLLPDAKETAARWREFCRVEGIGEIFLAYTQSFEAVDPLTYGFDAAVEFPPNNSSPPLITDTVTPVNPRYSGAVYDWRAFVQRSRDYSVPPYRLFRGVCPSWDKSARKPDGVSPFYTRHRRVTASGCSTRPSRQRAAFPIRTSGSSSLTHGTNGPRAHTSSRTKDTAMPIWRRREMHCSFRSVPSASSPK